MREVFIFYMCFGLIFFGIATTIYESKFDCFIVSIIWPIVLLIAIVVTIGKGAK